MRELTFTDKQSEVAGLMKRGEFRRLNILEGSVRSGKTWISLVLWAFWIASRPRDYLYMMCAKSLQTLKRNCLFPLQELIGERNFTFSLPKKEGVLFGRRIMLEGANDMRSEGKIRGITLGGAYCDELTLFPEDFFTMLLSRLSAPSAKLFATTNPDVPTHWLLKNYLENETLGDDIQRIFFSIDDNTTLPDDYINALKKEYTGVYYERFILGKWVVAQGAIYRIFSDNQKAYEIKSDELPKVFERVNIGLDFGGNGSKHAIVCTAIKGNTLYALKSERINPQNMTPQALYGKVRDFVNAILTEYGKIDALYADSAEQTLIAGLRQELAPLNIRVMNSRKNPINDRIRATTMLMGGGRFYIIPAACASLIDAFRGAVWNDKAVGAEERLDDGTSDIDSLDAFEYSFEVYIQQLVKLGYEKYKV